MNRTRRQVMKIGGGVFAALILRPARAATIHDIAMEGRPDGSRVWFQPAGIHIQPGDTLRWTNRDASNSHTVTAYHPDIYARPLRIPKGAKPWDSDYLLPNQSFSLTLTEEGVYDYYCVPHEAAGMVGRIVVGTPPAVEIAAAQPDPNLTPLPEAALNNFPSVQEILSKGAVRRG